MIDLRQGECIELMKTLPDQSIDLILADLPYETTTISWDQLIPFDLLWEQYERILSTKGCVVLFGAQPFTSKLVCSNLDWFKYSLVWDKNKCGSPGLAKIRPMITHEDILVFARGKTTYNPIMEEGEPYHRKSKNPEGYVGKHNNHGYGLKPRTEFHNEGTRYPKSIRRVSRDFSAQQQVHPTQKPVPLLRWLIKTYSNENETVLDNVMGSGSTGIAALLENRNFIGFELNEEYFKIASERILQAQDGNDLSN